MKKITFDKKKIKRFFREHGITAIPMLIDIFLFFCMFSLAYYLDSLNIVPSPSGYGATMLLALPCIATTILLMYFANVYRIVWRYAGTMELLRSAYDYSKDDLINLLTQNEPDIPMSRHCTAFRLYFTFTNVQAENMGTITEEDWNTFMKDEMGGGQFYIKIYMGPNFAEEYNVYADNVKNPDEKGYYVTNKQTYQPFEYSEFGTTSGTGGMIMFQGYGYETDLGNYLIAPLNTHLPATDFSIYAFIKYAPDPDNLPEDFLTSDEGAKWFQLQVPSMTLEPNRVHFIILGVDKGNLKVFKETTETNSTSTRATNNEPEEIKVNSVVVKDIVE